MQDQAEADDQNFLLHKILPDPEFKEENTKSHLNKPRLVYLSSAT